MQTMMVPVGGITPKAVPQHPLDPKDSPEEIAKDAQRDLRDNRFYNKPGATRGDYDRDWQECRLIARGSVTPAGTVPLVYNPAVISPLAAGVGGALGGMIGAAIAEGAQRRANRRSCLLIRGWRLVEAPDAVAARVTAMSDEEKNNYFNQIVGAQTVEGKITELKSFSLPPEAVGDLSASIQGPESVFMGKKVDPTVPLSLDGNEGAIVLAYRRNTPGSAGKFVTLNLARYDRAANDLVYQPRNWKKIGDKTTYHRDVPSGDRHAGLEVQVVKLTAGDYVFTGGGLGNAIVGSTHCFGAPTFHIGAGEVLYLGDFIPVWGAIGADGKKLFGLGYASRLDDSRRVLATTQPALAAALKQAELRNRATYACAAIAMDRWDLPGVAELEPIAPQAPAQDPAAAPAVGATASPSS